MKTAVLPGVLPAGVLPSILQGVLSSILQGDIPSVLQGDIPSVLPGDLPSVLPSLPSVANSAFSRFGTGVWQTNTRENCLLQQLSSLSSCTISTLLFCVACYALFHMTCDSIGFAALKLHSIPPRMVHFPCNPRLMCEHSLADAVFNIK
jgi:hypothetical protein